MQQTQRMTEAEKLAALGAYTQDSVEKKTIDITPLPVQSSTEASYAPAKYEKREIALVCEKHGEYTAKQTWYSSGWMGGACSKCKDEQYAERRKLEEESARAEAARKREDSMRRLISGSGVPTRYADVTLDSFIGVNEQARGVKDVAHDFINRFESPDVAGRSLIFCGVTGTGKTMLSCAIANEIIKHYRRYTVFMTINDAVRKVRKTYRDRSIDEQDTMNFFVKPDLLVLDEVGVQSGSDNELQILFDILNKRYLERRNSILISNLTLKDVQRYVGDRVMSRFSENSGGVLVFDWQDQRGKINHQAVGGLDNDNK